MFRRIALSLLLITFASAALAASFAIFQTYSPASQAGSTFQALKIGAGGWVRGISIAADGTRVARTDTYGAYLWGGSSWISLVTTNSIPSGDPMYPPSGCQNATANCGVYEIQIAPSNTNVAYMMLNGYTYVTTNLKSGASATWTATNFPQCTSCNSNQAYSQSGPHIAIDPADATKVVVGTYAGLYYSTNSGTSVSGPISSVPAPTGATNAQGMLVIYDPSTTSGGSTPGLYAASYGNGVYHTTTGPSGTWSSTSVSASNSLYMTIGPDGELYYLTDTGGCTLYLYSGSAWTTKTPGCFRTPLAGVAIDPAHPTFASNAYISVVDVGGSISYSTNSGTSWSTGQQTTRSCTGDVGWLCNTNETYMTTGQIAYDPSLSNKLLLSEGIGVWQGTPSTSAMNWNALSTGIENMIPTSAATAPGGNPMFTFWDRPIFTQTNLASYPTQHGLNYTYSIQIGAQVDYAKVGSPNTAFVASDYGANETSGKTTNNGGSDGGPSNWSTCASYPSASSPNTAWGTQKNGGNGETGAVAVSTSTNYMWLLSNNAALWYTTDGCNTWNIAQPTGIATSPSGANQGWNGAYYLNRHNICADVNSGYFYAYNAGSNAGSTSSAGIYKFSSGGAVGALAKSGNFDSFDEYNSTLGCVPGVAGEMFWASGSVTPGPYPHNESFYDCTDSAPGATGGSITCTTFANVKEVWSFGFGKAKPGGSGFPAIYIVGWVSNVFGLYRSDDHGATWNLMATYPCNSIDIPQVVQGDMNIYNRVYVGYHGSSFCYNP